MKQLQKFIEKYDRTGLLSDETSDIIVDYCKSAVVFDFGQFEKFWNIDQCQDLLASAKEFVSHGMFPLPYEVVCFRLVREHYSSWIFAMQETHRIHITRIDKHTNDEVDVVTQAVLSREGDATMLGVVDARKMYVRMADMPEATVEAFKTEATIGASWFLVLNMFLLSDFSVKEKTDLTKLNASRTKQGKPAYNEQYVVKVKPSVLQEGGYNAGAGGWTVRPHWRRGHIRVLQDGKKIAVKPCIVHGGEDIKKPTYKVG